MYSGLKYGVWKIMKVNELHFFRLYFIQYMIYVLTFFQDLFWWYFLEKYQVIKF